MRRLGFDQRADEAGRTEGPQVIEAFAYPHQLQGQLKLFGNRKRILGPGEPGEQRSADVDCHTEELDLV